ncbi:xyloglucan endo-transglycosylase/hydrolase1 [Zea mays]|uniref:Xyloglucan endo-transglycosylase/hydrolase1 n=1 Tax=Zea mays TaxID=4577 RepID=A0A1D6IYZ9_MAIZE|nr:xyloglucan endo-transglycosylase/hydrolase1 [Zea mays]
MARRSLALLLASSLALMAAAVASADSWLYDKFNTDGTVRTQYDAEWGTIRWAESNYMRYNYCDDGWRFPQGLPPECSRS